MTEARAQASSESAPKTPQDVFADVTWKWIEKRFIPLVSHVVVKHSDKQPLPFLVSLEFAKRYKKVVTQLVFPEFLVMASGVMREAQHMEEGQWQAHFQAAYDDPKNRKFLWEMWKRAWKATMEQESLPERPQPEKTSLVAKLLKKDKPSFGPKPLTDEQWQKKVEGIQKRNKIAAKNWSYLTAPSKAFVPPLNADNALLRNMFGLSLEALTKDIKAIRQIIEQGNNIGRTFDSFQKQRDVDMALLAVCYKLPNPLIEGEGVLKHLMLAHDKSEYPLTARFLPDFFRKS